MAEKLAEVILAMLVSVFSMKIGSALIVVSYASNQTSLNTNTVLFAEQGWMVVENEDAN